MNSLTAVHHSTLRLLYVQRLTTSYVCAVTRAQKLTDSQQ